MPSNKVLGEIFITMLWPASRIHTCSTNSISNARIMAKSLQGLMSSVRFRSGGIATFGVSITVERSKPRTRDFHHLPANMELLSLEHCQREKRLSTIDKANVSLISRPLVQNSQT